jgi:competence protein ComEC
MRSGTFHIFSVSGLHVGVISSALYLLFRLLRIPRPVTAGLTLAILWLYVQVTGGSSPALRAFLMIACVLATQVFRLPGNPLAALAASALLTLLLDPLQLFSTGFQMSYAVVVALVVMGRPLTEKWSATWRPFALLPTADWRWYHRRIDWAGRKLLTGAAACWVAFLASTPSGIGYFECFSPGSLLANLFIIPLSTLAIYAGFVSLVAGLVGLTAVSALLNAGAAVVIVTMDWLLQHGMALPGIWLPAHFRADWLAPVALGLMTAVFLAGAAGRWAPRYGGYWPPVVTLALLVILGVKFM